MSFQSSPETTPGAPDAPPQPPLEARLVQAGKLSMGQLAQAHRDRLETGKPLLDIIIERGWVTPDEIAELQGQRPPPAPTPAPAPVAAVEPAPPEPAPASVEAAAAAAPEPRPASGGAQEVLVGIRLTTGDLVPAGYAADPQHAATLGQAVVAELTQVDEGEWPFFADRFLKPETIVSVDLVVDDKD